MRGDVEGKGQVASWSRLPSTSCSSRCSTSLSPHCYSLHRSYVKRLMRFYLNSFMKTLSFFLGLLAFAEAVNAGHANEEFHEHLHLRPLDDGRVSARFSFTTILKDTAPRAPSSLREDDTRKTRMLRPVSMLLNSCSTYSPSITRCSHLRWVKF